MAHHQCSSAESFLGAGGFVNHAALGGGAAYKVAAFASRALGLLAMLADLPLRADGGGSEGNLDQIRAGWSGGRRMRFAVGLFVNDLGIAPV